MPFDNTRTMDERDGNYMVIGGVRYPVINSEVEAGRGEDRMLWRIVTQGQEEQPPAADATAPREGFRMPDKLLHRDSGGMPILPPYTPPAW